MKTDKDTQAIEVNAESQTQGMEAAVINNEVNAAEDKPLTEIQIKAKVILGKRLTLLAENGLNFEKRTGNFFKGTLIEKLDKDDKPVIGADGKAEKVLKRAVVNIDDAEAEDYIVLSEDVLKEVNAKRAAAFIADEDKKRAALDKLIKETEEAAVVAKSDKIKFENDLLAANDIVNAFELPVSASTSVSNSVKLAEATAKAEKALSENEKLRQLLIAAGIDPDAQ